MTVLRGHFDGQRVVLDDPIPSGIAPLTPVEVRFEENGTETVLDKLASLAGDDELPADYAEQHDHYVKGTPRR